MTTTTPRSALPLLAAAQAQKHVTHNDALLQLDALLFARFLDRDLSAPPSAPADGDTYLVHATASGDWTGKSGQIAYAVDGAWRFAAPFTGLVAYVVDELKLIVYDGGAWTDYASLLALQNVPLLGVNTTADTTNKFAAKSSAILLDNVGNGIQAKLNKHAAADTASLLYQTGYSGRAELGLAGDDDFHLKVSADGTTWYEALKLARAGGAATFVASATATAFVPSGSALPGNGLYLPAANTLGWAVNSAEKARLTSSGLSLLTAASNGALTVAGTTAPDADNSRDLGSASFQFRSAYPGTSLVFQGATISAKTGSGALVLAGSPTLTGMLTAPDSATWSSAGIAGLTKLGIGMTPSNALDITKTVNAGQSVASLVSAGTGNALVWWRAGDGAGHNGYFGAVGAGYASTGAFVAGYGLAYGDTGFSVVAAGGPLLFASNGIAEVARFDTVGNLLVGATARLDAERLSVVQGAGEAALLKNASATAYETLSLWNASTSGDNLFAKFYTEGTLTARGSISYNRAGGLVAYNTASDARLKTVLAEQRDFRAIIEAIWLGDVAFNAEPGSRVLAILAQQAHEHFPQAVSKPADDGGLWQADYGKLAPLALWGVKDLYARLDRLEAELAALKAQRAA